MHMVGEPGRVRLLTIDASGANYGVIVALFERPALSV